MNYTLNTKKSWQATLRELEETMRMWEIKEWDTNYPRGARSEARYQSEVDRIVKLTYVKNGKPVVLVMGKQSRAVDNLRVLYLAIEAMRMNEKRGIGDVIESAYLQLAAPPQKRNPYEVLQVSPSAPRELAEAAYKTLVKSAHPDAGGSAEKMKELNDAIEAVRKEKS